MRTSILRDDAIRTFLVRGVAMWVMVRLVFLLIGAVAQAGTSAVPHPFGVVLLAALLSVAEWRHRTERAFWRNFGVSLRTMTVVALAAAAAGEITLNIVIRYVIPHG